MSIAGFAAEVFLLSDGERVITPSVEAAHPDAMQDAYLLIAAKAWQIQVCLGEAATLMEAGVASIFPHSEDEKTFLLLLWEKVTPADKGWVGTLLEARVAEIIGRHDLKFSEK